MTPGRELQSVRKIDMKRPMEAVAMAFIRNATIQGHRQESEKNRRWQSWWREHTRHTASACGCGGYWKQPRVYGDEL